MANGNTSTCAAVPFEPTPLSPPENLMAHLHAAFDGDSTGVIVVRLGGYIEEAPLRTAVDLLQRSHMKLQVCIRTRADGRRYFERDSHPGPLALEILDFETESLPWEKEMYRSMSAAIDPASGPLARIVALRSRRGGICDLMFVVHHAIIDGVAAMRIMCDLLEFYEQAKTGSPQPPPEPRPLISIGRASLPGSALTRLPLIVRLAWQMRGKRKGAWSSLPAGSPAEKRFILRHVLGEAETAALGVRCREEGCSLTGAIFAAGVCAVAEAAPPPLRIRCRMPISIRSSLAGPAGPLTDRDVGCFISGYPAVFDLREPPLFWDFARRIRNDLKTFRAYGGPQLLYNLIRFVRVSTFMVAPKRETLAVNHFGVAPLRPTYAGLTVEASSSTGKSDRLGPSLGVMTVTVNGRLCVTVATTDVPADFSGRFSSAVFRHLREASRHRSS